MVRSGNAHELYEYDAQLRFQNRLVSPGDIALPFNHLAYEALLFVLFPSVVPSCVLRITRFQPHRSRDYI